MEALRLIGVVEDHEYLRYVLEQMVRSCGYEPAMFGSAEELLAASGGRVFDCLVVDLSLPGMSGLQLEASLRRQGMTIPFILTTGFDLTMIAAIGSASLVAVLQKPFGIVELETALRKAFKEAAGQSPPGNQRAEEDSHATE